MAKGKKNKSKGNKSKSSNKQPQQQQQSGEEASGGDGSNDGNAAHTQNSGKKKEDLDDLNWLKECDTRRDADGEAYLQLEYQDDDELMLLLKEFLETSSATKVLVDNIYQIWQQTVLSTLLASSALWKKDQVQSSDQRQMKDQLKTARYKINFIMHHAVGSMLASQQPKWKDRHQDLLQLCYQTLQLLPRLAESCPHHRTDIRQCIIHFEGKEFLAAVACETWDTLYDYSIPIDPQRFIPILRRCAMLDILDKDWNMLGGWDDILKGLEAKCCLSGPVLRLPCDVLLHEHTTILRNARNSMQCKFFSVRFMRYTEDQAPQRWRYFPKCSAPACSSIETAQAPHPFRCTQCWYFHYCSESCQEYCDAIMGLHPKFCRDTPVTKAQLCKQETEQHLGWASPAAAATSPDAQRDLLCHACGCSERLVAGGGDSSSSGMKRCSKCQSVYYCSRQCQEWDWRIGGHKTQCNADGKKSEAPASVDSGSQDDGGDGASLATAEATNVTENGSSNKAAAPAVAATSNGSAGNNGSLKDLN